MSAKQMKLTFTFDKEEIEQMWNITFDSDEKWNNFVKFYQDSFISKMEDAIHDAEFRDDIIDRAAGDRLCRDNLDDDDDNLDDDVGLWIELREPQRMFESDKDYAERLAAADELESLENYKKNYEKLVNYTKNQKEPLDKDELESCVNYKKSLEEVLAELESLKPVGETK